MSDTERTGSDTGDRLLGLLNRLLTDHFSDIRNPETIRIRTGRRSRLRLGSVRSGRHGPEITINPLLMLDGVPESVAMATVAHELCHIVHGYGTHQRPKHPPHRGGRINAELRARGLDELEASAHAWVRNNWQGWFERHAPDLAELRSERTDARDRAWLAVLSSPGMRSADDMHRWSHGIAIELGVAPLHGVEWLHAGSRRKGLSYCRVRDRVVLLHGVLAYKAVPESVLRYETAAWLEYLNRDHRSTRKFSIEQTMPRHEIEEARHWRRYSWTRFRRKHTPPSLPKPAPHHDSLCNTCMLLSHHT